MTEEKFLHQIHLEEQFGSSTKLDTTKDKKKSANNAAIGYNYETEEPIPEPVKSGDPVISEEKGDDEDSDIDLGIIILSYAIFFLYILKQYQKKGITFFNMTLFFIRYMRRCISNRTISSTRDESGSSKIWTFGC